MQLESNRREYNRNQLTRDSLPNNPMELFSTWMSEAINAHVNDATAMSLSTVNANGFPESRIVLLKDYGEKGFTFFTNYSSAKGKSIEETNKVSLHFYWSELERQIRITGTATKTTYEISLKYFNSRPLGSQIAAIISDQSKEVHSRIILEERYKALQNSLNGSPPKCPSNWGGYIVKPIKIEFWQGRRNRLHDRFLYENNSGKWSIKQLAP